MTLNMKKLVICFVTFALLFAGTVYAAQKEIVLCSWGGTYEKAIVNFNKAISLAPDMSAAYSYRAEAFRMNGQLSEAFEDVEKAIVLESNLQILSDVYRTRGKVYRELGQDKSAAASFKKAAEIDPRYVFYRYISGYADLEDIGKAGLFGMIGMAFVFIFGFKLKPPRKDE